MPNSRAGVARCRRLNVTNRSARPLTAVSSTISSAGSFSRGRHKKRSGTGTATFANASRISFISVALNPLASKCSCRVRTASYSTISGTGTRNSTLWSRAHSRICRDAPRSLRSAATRTPVSRTSRKYQHITCNIADLVSPAPALPPGKLTDYRAAATSVVSNFVRIWNGALSTIPMTIEESR